MSRRSWLNLVHAREETGKEVRSLSSHATLRVEGREGDPRSSPGGVLLRKGCSTRGRGVLLGAARAATRAHLAFKVLVGGGVLHRADRATMRSHPGHCILKAIYVGDKVYRALCFHGLICVDARRSMKVNLLVAGAVLPHSSVLTSFHGHRVVFMFACACVTLRLFI